MKTTLEWLQELPDGYRERAIKNYEEDKRQTEHVPATDLADAICMAFRWAKTPEGYTFWQEVCAWANPKSLPPLPKD